MNLLKFSRTLTNNATTLQLAQANQREASKANQMMIREQDTAAYIAHPSVQQSYGASKKASNKTSDVSKVVHEGQQTQDGEHSSDQGQQEYGEPVVLIPPPMNQLVSPNST